MILCTGKLTLKPYLDTRHEAICFEGDAPEECPLCEALKELGRMEREHRQEIQILIEDGIPRE